MVCVLGRSDRSKDSNLIAVVVIQVIMVLLMVTWTMMIVDGGSEEWSHIVWR